MSLSLCDFSSRYTCSASSLSSRSIFSFLRENYILLLQYFVLVDVLRYLSVGLVARLFLGGFGVVVQLVQQRVGVLALRRSVVVLIESAERRDVDALSFSSPPLLEALAAVLDLSSALSGPGVASSALLHPPLVVVALHRVLSQLSHLNYREE